jgi:hypothetical protein
MDVEIRPAHVDDWLDTLPYTNAEKCFETLEWALTETNKKGLKPQLRLELLELYWPRYRYLLDAKIRPARGGAARAAQGRGAPIASARRVAEEFAVGFRLSIREGLSHKALFRTSKPPSKGTLFAMTACGHALLLGHAGYAPIPTNLWREIHELYEYGEALEFLDESLPDPDGRKSDKTTLRRTYVRICATALVDPHRLELGDIWQVYELAGQRIEEIRITPFTPMPETLGVFVIDLHASSGPISYNKLKPDRTTPHLRLLHCAALAQACTAELKQAARPAGARPLDAGAQRSRLLARLIQAWGESSKRTQARQDATDTVEVVVGIHAVYGTLAGSAAHELHEDAVRIQTAVPVQWQVVNAGAGGFGLYTSEHAQPAVRVGDLLVLKAAGGSWTLATVRWLIVERSKAYKIGVQTLARSAKAVRIRAKNGAEVATRRRPAFVLDPLRAGDFYSILTGPGLYAPGAGLELSMGAQRQIITCGDLVDSTVAFERFTYLT